MEKNIKILVVDDFSTMRRTVRNLLVQTGFTDTLIEEAEDGNAALEVLRAKSFDLVVTDRNMPGMAGIDLLRAIRADTVLKPIPVLMVMPENNREQISEAEQSGVNSYVVKPFTAATWKAALEKILGGG